MAAVANQEAKAESQIADVKQALANLERDCTAVATAFNQLLSTMQASVKNITNISVQYMELLSKSAKVGLAFITESSSTFVLQGLHDSLEKGVEETMKLVNKCAELDGELRKVDALETQL